MKEKVIKSLFIDITQLPPEGSEFSGFIPPERLDLKDLDNFEIPEDIELSFMIKLTGSEYSVSGSINVPLETKCIRCLEMMDHDLNIDFLHTGSIYSQGKTPLSRVDISPYIREEIILNIPAYPLCDDDCRGICPQCGQNLNLYECNCENNID